ncbi:MAG: MerC domain-containing protein [Bacteroidota bacterium]
MALFDPTLGVWDRLGLSLSGLCMVHCLLFPMLLAVLPLWPVLEGTHEALHIIFAVLLVPLTLAAAITGYRRHRSRFVLALLGAGMVFVTLVAVLGHHGLSAPVETMVTVGGSVLLLVGHWQNWRRSTAQQHTQTHPAHATT